MTHIITHESLRKSKEKISNLTKSFIVIIVWTMEFIRKLTLENQQRGWWRWVSDDVVFLNKKKLVIQGEKTVQFVVWLVDCLGDGNAKRGNLQRITWLPIICCFPCQVRNWLVSVIRPRVIHNNFSHYLSLGIKSNIHQLQLNYLLSGHSFVLNVISFLYSLNNKIKVD